MTKIFKYKPGTAQVSVPLKAQNRAENPKKLYTTEKLTLKLYIGRKLCGILRKNRKRYT